MLLVDTKAAKEGKPGNWKIKVAEENIQVFKLVREVDGDPGKWKAYYQGLVYSRNVELIACEHLEILHEFEKLGYDAIRCGFHAFTKNEFPGLTEAIIPKGAEYCENLYGEVVSNRIIVR